MYKKNGVLLASAVLLAAVLLFLTACDLFSNKPDELLQKIDAQVAYDNAPFADISIGIIPGSLSAVPTEAPRQKVGYPFMVQAAANSGYGFSGWQVLTKAQWDGLDLQSATFEADFITAAQNANADNALATISDTLGVDGKPSGGASITAHTANPLVIVPYATLRPAISSASYPAMNARDINYRIPIAIRFDAPVAAESFLWQEGETHDPWDIKNVTISAVKANGDSVPTETIEALFNTGVTSGMGLDDSGKILSLKLDAASLGTLSALDFEQCQITIALGGNIERRGSPDVKIMPRQELVFTTTTASTVSTVLSGLGISIGGLPPTGYNFESTNYKYTINTFAKSGDIIITPTAVGGTLVDITITVKEITETVASGNPTTQTHTIVPGKNTIQVNIAPSGGSVLSTYIVTIENYPAVDMPEVTLTPAAGQISATWGAIGGASSYEVRYSTGNNQDTATSQPVAGADTTSALITGLAAGTTYNVWVRAIAGSGANALYGNYSTVKSATTQSSVARLSALTVGGGALYPVFSEEQYNYTVTLNNQAVAYTITPTAKNSGTLAMTLNAVSQGTVPSGVAKPLTLAKGRNTVSIAVTPQAGGTAQTYTITIDNYPAAAVPVVTLTTPAAGEIRASWTPTGGVGGASSYELRYSTGTNPDTAAPQPVEGAGTTSALITGLAAGTTYNVWVRAIAGSGANALYGYYSAVKSATIFSTTNILTNFQVNGIGIPPVRTVLHPEVTTFYLEDHVAYSTTAKATVNAESVSTAQVNINNLGYKTSSSIETIDLNLGLNKIPIKIRSQAGTEQEYTVKIYMRPPAPTVTLTATAASPNINASWTTISYTDGETGYQVQSNTVGLGGSSWVDKGSDTTAAVPSIAGTNNYAYVRSRITASDGEILYSDASEQRSMDTTAELTAMTAGVSTGTMEGSFSTSVLQYNLPRIKYSNLTPAVTITATASRAGSTITASGNNGTTTTVPSGVATAVSVVTMSNGTTNASGANTVFERPVELKVSAPHPYYTKTYRINVRRNGVKIGSGSSTDPAFDYYANMGEAFSACNNNVFLAEGEYPINATINLTAAGMICAAPGATAVLKRTFAGSGSATNGPIINFQSPSFTFNFNRASTSGDSGTLIIDGDNIEAKGPAVRILGAFTAYFRPGVIIRNNKSSGVQGGGIFAQNNNGGSLSGAIIQNNYSSASGGGVYVTNTNSTALNVTGAIIRNNEATNYGGGLYIYQDQGTYINLSSITVEGNTVGSWGGGVFTNGKPVRTTAATIIRNNTGGTRGGIYAASGWYTDFSDFDRSGITGNSPNDY